MEITILSKWDGDTTVTVERSGALPSWAEEEPTPEQQPYYVVATPKREGAPIYLNWYVLSKMVGPRLTMDGNNRLKRAVIPPMGITMSKWAAWQMYPIYMRFVVKPEPESISWLARQLFRVICEALEDRDPPGNTLSRLSLVELRELTRAVGTIMTKGNYGLLIPFLNELWDVIEGCKRCHYYSGLMELHCAVHPMGWVGSCGDYTPKQKNVSYLSMSDILERVAAQML